MAGTLIQTYVFGGREVAVNPNFTLGAAQMECPNGAPTLLHIKTLAGGGAVVTVVNQTTSPAGDPNPNEVINIGGANQIRIVRLNPGVFNMSNGNAQLNIDIPANVSMVAYQVQ